MNDNVIELSKRLKERKSKAAEQAEIEEIPAVEVPRPSLVDIASFIQVLGWLRQLAPDGSGRIEFDDFAARIQLDANKLDFDEYEPQVNVALSIEGIIPLVWHTLEPVNPDEDTVSIEEIVDIAAYIIKELEPDEVLGPVE